MSVFKRSMDFSVPPSGYFRLIGEKGTLEHTAQGVGSARVAFFFALVRGLSDESLHEQIDACLREAAEAGHSDPIKAAGVIADLFVLTFQTRNCRGGKGEKSLFDRMFLGLHRVYPQTAEMLVGFIPRFGCFKDYFRLLNLLDEKTEYINLRRKIVLKIAQQLHRDADALDSFNAAAAQAAPGDEAKRAPPISLCAKFAPREGSSMVQSAVGKAWFKQLREIMFPSSAGSDSVSSKQQYRRLVSRLTAALDVPEVKMCGKTFRDIDFSHVPSLCLNRNRKAFLNEAMPVVQRARVEARGGYLRGAMRVFAGRQVAGALRHPENEDRMECRRHLIEATMSKKLHGKQLHPHVLVSQLMPSYGTASRSLAENEIANVQWAKIRDDLVANMDKLNKQQEPIQLESAKRVCISASDKLDSNRPIDFTKLVPLVDVSGSMHGDPMHAAIALGILTSEVNHVAFRNRFITFSERPSWVSLDPAASIADKVAVTAAADWGGTTNIEAAFDLILQVVVKERLPAEEIPDLIIFSDMQFDQATSGRQTQLETIRSRFAAVGVEVSGQPYPAPRIVFWNLRAVSYGGYPAQCESENVQMLSGFSPSMLEVVLNGGAVGSLVEQVVENGVEVSRARNVTPYDTLRTVLDSDKYYPIRQALARSQEGLLSAYSFERPTTSVAGASPSAAVEPAGAMTPATATAGDLMALELEDDWEVV